MIKIIALVFSVFFIVQICHGQKKEELEEFSSSLLELGLLDTIAYIQLTDDLKQGKVSDKIRVIGYCQMAKVFELTKYPNDYSGDSLLHYDIAKIFSSQNNANLNFHDLQVNKDGRDGFSVQYVRVYADIETDVFGYEYIAVLTITKRDYQYKNYCYGRRNFYDIFNFVLSDQKSPYRLVRISLTDLEKVLENPEELDLYMEDVPYIIERLNEDSINIDHTSSKEKNERLLSSKDSTTNPIFVIIALKESELKAFKKIDYKLIIEPAYYAEYIPAENVKKGIMEIKKSGLFNNWSKSDFEGVIKKSLEEPYANFNDILIPFPKIVYSIYEKRKATGKDIIVGLANITNGKFHPEEVTEGYKIDDSNNKVVSYSFRFQNKAYKDESYMFLINRALTENGIEGRFYQLYRTRQSEIKDIRISYVFLTPFQYQELKEKALISFAPLTLIGMDEFDSEDYENDILKSWEVHYKE